MASLFREDGGKTASCGCKGQSIPLQADGFYHLRLWHRYAIWSRSMLLPYAKYNCFSYLPPFFFFLLDATLIPIRPPAERIRHRAGIQRLVSSPVFGLLADGVSSGSFSFVTFWMTSITGVFVIYIGKCHLMFDLIQLIASGAFVSTR